MYGFSVAIHKYRSNDDSVRLDVLNKDENCSYDQLNPSVLVCTSGSNKSNFVNYCSFDDWIIIGIGKLFSGSAFALGLKIELEKKCRECINLECLLDVIQNLPGQYCGVLYNTKTGDLAKITDPSGSRSLFYGDFGDTIVVASSLSMLRKLISKEDIQPNLENQSFLLRYAYSIPGQSVYNGVSEMSAGKLIYGNAYSKETNTSELINCAGSEYSNELLIDAGIKKLKDSNEKVLFECIRDACAQQLGNTRKVGVLLGGFDSALVASVLHHLGVEVETYSFYYNQNKYNQPYTDLLAKTLGITHHWVKIDSEVIKDGIDKYNENCSWPTMWLSYVIQTQFLCKRMSEDGMEMCFSGDGCDTAFLGYPSTHRRGQVYQRLPRISNNVSKLVTSFIHYTRLEYYFGHLARVGVSLVDAATKPVDERPLHSFQIFNNSSYKYLTGKKYISYESHAEHFSNAYSNFEQYSYERKIYLTKSFISPNRAKLVSSSDISGMPIHSPYLHHKVKEFSRDLPDEKLRPSNSSHSKEGKYILMKMAENSGLLPSEIIYQSKIAAVNSPIDDWLAKDLYTFANKKLAYLPFSYESGYTKNLLGDLFLEKIYKDYFSSDGVVSLAPSLLLTYASLFE